MRARRRAVQLAVVTGIFGASVMGYAPLSPAPAGADSGASFDALANAYGVDPTLTNASLPLGLTVEGAGPVAQAHLDSIGDSDGLASFPYPGDTVAGLPGTAGALFGVPIPQYPLYVTSQAGDAPKVGGLPGVSLQAASYPSVALGQAVVGSGLAGFTSTATVSVNSDNSVTASAQTTLGTNLLNLITLSGVDSSAKVVADGNTGELTRSSHLSIGQISVPGLNIVVPSGTPSTIPIPIPVPGVPQLPPINFPVLPLPLGGETLLAPDLGFEDGSFTVTLPAPIGKPLTFAIPAQLVLGAFKALGINITYEVAQTNATGVIAPALTFAYKVPAPPKNNYVNGPTDVAFVLGRSTASVTLHPAVASGGDSGGFSGGTGGFTSGGGTGSSGGVSGVTVGSTGSTGSGGALLPLTGGSTGTTPLTGAGGGGSTAPTSGGGGQAVALVSRDAARADLSGLYLVGLAVAGAVIAAASVLKVMGVRLLWAS